MADGRHIENRFLAISRRHIGRLMRNLDWRWRIPCGYISLDQDGNFRKFKMADGRHFENSFISIVQPWIIRFRSNLICGCEFPSREKVEILQIQDGGRTPYWKSFLPISRRHIGRVMRNLRRRRESHADIGLVTTMAIFANSGWPTAAILKIALSPYLSRQLSDFDQIWCTNANYHFEDGYLTEDRNFVNSRWRTDAILKIVFGYISAPF